ncbi:sugar ABC transporter substrate-binding protein [Nocardioides sp. R1-1]|uniref:sugar ABC transporter substrate-binding protein n=1 Tax=Nocardioides sp. R1-1 TaxID=3383502 RepID=UPI0038D0131E
MSTTAKHPLDRRTFLSWTGGIGAAVLASACTAPATTKSSGDRVAGSSKDVDTVAWDYPFTFLPVYAGVARFAKARAKERGVSLEQTNDNGKPDVQATNLDTLIAKKVPAIVSFPMVFEALEAQAARALSAGIIWVTYGGTLENQSASITFSFEEGGRQLGADAAAWAQEQLGGRGKVAFLVDDTIQLGRERTAGMIEAFTQAAPDMEVVGREQAIDPDTALSKTKAILAKHPDVQVVLGITDGAAFGAYKALVESGRAEDDARTYVGGQDGDLGSLELIRRGTFYRASAALQLRDIGNAVIDVPLAVADGKSDAEASADVPITLVKQGDALLDEIIAQYG